MAMRYNTTGLVFPRGQIDQDRFLEALPALLYRGKPIVAKKASDAIETVLLTLFVEGPIIRKTGFNTPAKFWRGVEAQNSAAAASDPCHIWPAVDIPSDPFQWKAVPGNAGKTLYVSVDKKLAKWIRDQQQGKIGTPQGITDVWHRRQPLLPGCAIVFADGKDIEAEAMAVDDGNHLPLPHQAGDGGDDEPPPPDNSEEGADTDDAYEEEA